MPANKPPLRSLWVYRNHNIQTGPPQYNLPLSFLTSRLNEVSSPGLLVILRPPHTSIRGYLLFSYPLARLPFWKTLPDMHGMVIPLIPLFSFPFSQLDYLFYFHSRWYSLLMWVISTPRYGITSFLRIKFRRVYSISLSTMNVTSSMALSMFLTVGKLKCGSVNETFRPLYFQL